MIKIETNSRTRYPDELVAKIKDLCDIYEGATEAEYRYSLAMIEYTITEFFGQ